MFLRLALSSAVIESSWHLPFLLLKWKQDQDTYFNHWLVLLLLRVCDCVKLGPCESGPLNSIPSRAATLPGPLAPPSSAAPTCEGTFFGGSIRIDGSHSPGGKTVT